MDMRFLLMSLLVLQLWEAGEASALQALKTKGFEIPARDTDEAWDKHTPEPLGKDHPLWGLMHLGLLPAIKFLAETQQQGLSATADSKDLLAALRSPVEGPEPDQDPLHHAVSEDGWVEAEPRSQALLRRLVLSGPEEDRDHIHHQSGDSQGP